MKPLLVVLLCILNATISSVDGRRDRVQVAFEHHLLRTPNKSGLASNETFTQQMFASFCDAHPRFHRSKHERTQRFQMFQEKLGEVLATTQEINRTFTVGLNKFSDWTPSELEILRGAKPPSAPVRAMFVTMNAVQSQSGSASTKQKTAAVPATFDYTTRVSTVNPNTTIVRPVRDQGQCGSCYAFAMITLVEAQYALQYGKAVNMSEQQIIDCSTGDFGCTGGYFDTSFAYLKSYNWYLDSALSYPYAAVASNCSAKKTNGWSVGDLVYRHVPTKNASAMQHALVTFGPLWVSLYIGSDCSGKAASSCPVKPSAAKTIMNSFQSYTGGIFQASGCVTSADNNNHAMVIVGYGYDPVTKLNYWKARNSWGDGWGEDGYVRFRRDVNMCNIESDAFFLAKPAS